MPADSTVQRFTLQQFHGDEGLPFELANVVNSTDVGVVQCGGGVSFSLKTFEGCGVARESLRQELQGHRAMEPRVFRLVYDSHPAAAQFLQNAEALQHPTDWHRISL